MYPTMEYEVEGWILEHKGVTSEVPTGICDDEGYTWGDEK